MSPATLADVVAALERRYPPRTAESWDAVGLTAGDPAAPVRRVLLAVDPVAAVVDEALAWDADLLLTHHPLYLRGVHSVAATTYKGALVHRLVRGGCALYTAHTNADAARGGVAEALADALGVVDTVPLVPVPAPALDKVVVFVPADHADALVDALASAGAGVLGDYERAAWTTTGEGTFTPLEGAAPAIGAVGRREHVRETRVEMVAPRTDRSRVLAALRAAHPYEEPAYDVLELAPEPGPTGLGRVGSLREPVTLAAFAAAVAGAVPATAQGVRYAGDPDMLVRRVAVLGGSGDSLFDAVRAADVDAYVTADLRHHPASEQQERAAFEAGGGAPRPALVDLAHSASEWPWLVRAAAGLVADLQAQGTTVETRVSTLRTDPWTGHVPQTASTQPEGTP
ncbi:Nif3-like dinuclear metal center hexameric protein [Cellulomonas shaoxiangyii]|uniref:GTP cyclohydrolase 1 type 2 homolog n=1 Tax=Cellulomonas shaoxiangyii TaxID=2566013 RepID=A0A4P7SLB2_9CELL|nr:Nif3-like dinuclear metal center hexameric protein [Cellulomonas shaoxiangyii]QCB93353.1 Nif3-like dinuclear metal center hexameric protein [Cellulomonas shaoxiangyii]TGY85315.1 Nif3-like dinuclear metal center hexameric protein [Cellulomonas shaoxiangyii]